MNNFHNAIVNHYENVWKTKGSENKWNKGPVHELPQNFCVLEFPPHGERDMWTYATCEMSQPIDNRPLELHIYSKYQNKELIKLLTVIAHFHRTGKYLDLGHTVNFGRSWLPNSSCQHGLLSLPYLDGETLEILKFENCTIQFLWLIPITKKELDFKKEFGLDDLEQKFEENNFDYTDPYRQSVV